MAGSRAVMLAWLLLVIAAAHCSGEVVMSRSSTNQTALLCEPQQHQQQINEKVQQFVNDSRWYQLRQDLVDLLGNSSEASAQMWKMNRFTAPLFWLGVGNYTALARLLLCAGLPINAVDEVTNTSMLHGAAFGNNLRLVQLLVGWGADLEAREKWLDTPLLKAVGGNGNGSLEMIRWLVEAGADTTAQSRDGYTAYSMAVRNGHTALADYLSPLPH
ncbi:ankyrin repeat and SOCS box protein 3-like [Bacillus rossius redtenbacheri]|uniref:ankyrin repeat and SOCS box protein 3-like n=1 Tax=Bacillus rossius redtenbacheri TaxID=93214 RepID=UPI002FDD339D